MTTICIDTETFYSDDCTVRTLGNYNYVRHPEWYCYLVSIAGDNGLRYVGPPENAPWGEIFNPKHRLIAHNSGFDKAVIYRLHEQGIIPKPEFAVWDDTADLASFLGIPRGLKSAAKILLGAEMNKDVRDRMKGKHFAELPEDQKQEVVDYAMGDADRTLEIWVKYHDRWSEGERWLARHTRGMSEVGLPIDYAKLKAGIEKLESQIADAEKAIPWFEATGKALSRDHLETECAKYNLEVPKSLAKDDPECIAWEDEHGDTYPFIGAIRNYRRCNMLYKKLCTIDSQLLASGYAPVLLKYFGGHTGRWSGDGGVNYQNLPRGELFGVNLRSLLRAPEGKTFITVDLSQIEARITLWFAGDVKTLDLIRGGMDLYEAHARATMGYSDPRPLKEYDKVMGTAIRQMAKVRVLGLGFGCGAVKFITVAKIMSGGEVNLTLEESKKVVEAYRSFNRGVVTTWRKLEGHVAKHAHTGMDAEFELPSGRKMVFKDVKNLGGKLSVLSCQGGSLYRKYTWGGTLLENLVQATARDILGYYIKILADEGVDIRLHVHDEIVALCDEADANRILNRMLEVMSVPPPWISDLPIAAEGDISNYYKK